jgi:hypothetical protein
MADGMWKMNEDGSWELQEPYRTQLVEARLAATRAWTEALIGYLEPRCPYTAQELADELVRRNEQRDEGKVMIFEEFVIEALSGDL